MGPPQLAFNKPVAELVFRHSQLSPVQRDRLSMGAGEQFNLGRQDVDRIFHVQDFTISSHHLQFHCIEFDQCEEGVGQVPPLVYMTVLSRNPVRLYPSKRRDGRGYIIIHASDGAHLLGQNDVIQLNWAISVAYRDTSIPNADFSALTACQQQESAAFAHQYQLAARLLGTGAWGSVYLAIETATNRQIACKVVPFGGQRQKEQSDDGASRFIDREARLRREYLILKDLDHPNIVRLEKVIVTNHNFYILNELIPGGDLMSLIQGRGCMSEPQTIVVVKQILAAVAYLHAQGIAHRDIKPENVLVASWNDGARVILTDFGGACRHSNEPNQAFRMQTIVGTPGYQAPYHDPLRGHFCFSLTCGTREIFPGFGRRGYTPTADIWSVGCLTVSLLSGNTPYEPEEINSLAQFSDTSWVHAHKEKLEEVMAWKSISRMAKRFIIACLSLDARHRPSAMEALKDMWFTHRDYAQDVDAAYRRAIRNWSPRIVPKGSQIVEFLDVLEVEGKQSTGSRAQGSE